jgi:hypothetical protein
MGRIDDVLNVSGHRLGTMEIESALVAHPLVAEAAVVGRPHEIKGEAVVAFVVLKGARPTGAAAHEIARTLRDWVAQEIGPIAKPDDIRFGDNLPKTRSGKIMRRLLRDRWRRARRSRRTSRRSRTRRSSSSFGSRYGKSRAVAGLVTGISAIGVLPYIALQLKAISSTFDALSGGGGASVASKFPDSAFALAVMLAIFTILFGIRAVQATEQHRGHDAGHRLRVAGQAGGLPGGGLLRLGPGARTGAELPGADRGQPPRRRAAVRPGPRRQLAGAGLLSAAAFLCLPRQFHVAVVEHDHAANLRWARWMFPLYLFLINLFVAADRRRRTAALAPDGTANPDLFVLSLPLPSSARACRCWSSSAGSRQRPQWSSSKPSHCRPWSATIW